MKPAAAPKPEIVGRLNGKMIASGMRENSCCSARHDAGDVQLRGVALFPRLQANEERAEVRLVGRGDEAVAADRLKRLDSLRLFDDPLDFRQHRAGALERGGRRQRDVDAHDALILIGNEARGKRAAEEAGADSHPGDDDDRERGPPHQEARPVDVPSRGHVERLVEERIELAEKAGGLCVVRLQQHRRKRRRRATAR